MDSKITVERVQPVQPPAIHGTSTATDPTAAAAAQANRASVFGSIAAYGVCSSTMLLANKLATHYIPAPALVSAAQIVVCIVFVVHLHCAGVITVERPTKRRLVPYANYSVLFALSLFTNMHSLQHSNVETVIVFRSATPLAVAIADYIFLGRQLPGIRSVSSLLGILVGAAIYVGEDSQFKMEGLAAYSWVTF